MDSGPKHQKTTPGKMKMKFSHILIFLISFYLLSIAELANSIIEIAKIARKMKNSRLSFKKVSGGFYFHPPDFSFDVLVQNPYPM